MFYRRVQTLPRTALTTSLRYAAVSTDLPGKCTLYMLFEFPSYCYPVSGHRTTREQLFHLTQAPASPLHCGHQPHGSPENALQKTFKHSDLMLCWLKSTMLGGILKTSSQAPALQLDNFLTAFGLP